MQVRDKDALIEAMEHHSGFAHQVRRQPTYHHGSLLKAVREEVEAYGGNISEPRDQRAALGPALANEIDISIEKALKWGKARKGS